MSGKAWLKIFIGGLLFDIGLAYFLIRLFGDTEKPDWVHVGLLVLAFWAVQFVVALKLFLGWLFVYWLTTKSEIMARVRECYMQYELPPYAFEFETIIQYLDGVIANTEVAPIARRAALADLAALNTIHSYAPLRAIFVRRAYSEAFKELNSARRTY